MKKIGIAVALLTAVILLYPLPASAAGPKEPPCTEQSWDNVVGITCTYKKATPGGVATHIETEIKWYIDGELYSSYTQVWNGACKNDICRSKNVWRYEIDGQKYILITIFNPDPTVSISRAVGQKK